MKRRAYNVYKDECVMLYDGCHVWLPYGEGWRPGTIIKMNRTKAKISSLAYAGTKREKLQVVNRSPEILVQRDPKLKGKDKPTYKAMGQCHYDQRKKESESKGGGVM